MKQKKTSVSAILFSVFLFAIFAFYGILNHLTPNEISMFSGENPEDKLDSVLVSSSISITENNNNTVYSKGSIKTNLLGIIPLKSVDVNVYKDIKLIPGGNAFGVKLYTKGVIVVGLSGENSEFENPAKLAGIKVKDIIISVDGKETNSVDEIKAKIQASGGNPVEIVIDRNGETIKTYLTPKYSESAEGYIAGLWIRDTTAGIGTVTYINKENNTFAGLGHGINDIDTGEIMPLRKGEVSYVKINGVTKGVEGKPGELKGIFTTENAGVLDKNTEFGVFGRLDILPDSTEEEVSIALKDEVSIGDAEIICTVGEEKKHYSAEIVKKNDSNAETKNFVIKITDKELLEKTGGIVQGMSGSPVIQNGKLIGAVTHVLVDDPTKGYGIYIENMLKNAE